MEKPREKKKLHKLSTNHIQSKTGTPNGQTEKSVTVGEWTQQWEDLWTRVTTCDFFFSHMLKFSFPPISPKKSFKKKLAQNTPKEIRKTERQGALFRNLSASGLSVVALAF